MSQIIDLSSRNLIIFLILFFNFHQKLSILTCDAYKIFKSSIFSPYQRYSSSLLLHGSSNKNHNDGTDAGAALRQEAFELLDCLTSPRDIDNPEYNPIKANRREKLLRDIDYYELVQEMEFRGLSKLGDKTELITRLLLNIIDPSIRFEQTSGLEPNLRYVTEEDISDHVVELIPEENRKTTADLIEYDADDIRISRKRFPNSPKNIVGGSRSSRSKAREVMVMDDLNRQETNFPSLQFFRSADTVQYEDKESNGFERELGTQRYHIHAYVVRSNDLTKKWSNLKSAIILLPDLPHGWMDKNLRVIADELAFSTQSLIVVPDIYRSHLLSAEAVDLSRSVFSIFAEVKEAEFGGSLLRKPGDFCFVSHLQQGLDEQQTGNIEAIEDWLSVLHNDTIHDDIIATINHVRQEYDIETVSLAGVGYGAGRALEIATTLYEIGRNVLYEETKQEAEGAEWDALSQYDTVASVLKENEALREVVGQKIAKYRDVFLKIPSVDALLPPEGQDEEDDDYVEDYFEELARRKYQEDILSDDESDFLEWIQQRPSTMNDISSSSNSSGINRSNNSDSSRSSSQSMMPNEEEMVAMFNEVLEESPDLSKQVEKMKEEIRRSKGTNVAGKVSNAGNIELDNSIDALQAVHEADIHELEQHERDSSMDSGRRNSDTLVSEWKSTLLTVSNLQKKEYSRNDIFEYEDIARLCPRAVLAVGPHHYDAKRVGESIVVPTMILFESNSKQPDGSIDDALLLTTRLMDRVQRGDVPFWWDYPALGAGAKGLLDHVENQKNTTSESSRNDVNPIVDFCVRVYEGLDSGSFRSPVTINAMKSSQEMLLLGSLWLDSFAAVNADKLTIGAGTTKFTSQCFAIVSKQHMKMMHLGAPHVATYVHDTDEVHHRGRWY